ncbi:unnamed protein product [Caenorhabditis nigoni]
MRILPTSQLLPGHSPKRKTTMQILKHRFCEAVYKEDVFCWTMIQDRSGLPKEHTEEHGFELWIPESTKFLFLSKLFLDTPEYDPFFFDLVRCFPFCRPGTGIIGFSI